MQVIIIYGDFIPDGRMVNKEIYDNILKRLRDGIRKENPPEKMENTQLDYVARQCSSISIPTVEAEPRETYGHYVGTSSIFSPSAPEKFFYFLFD